MMVTFRFSLYPARAVATSLSLLCPAGNAAKETITTSLFIRAADRVTAQMEMIIPSFARVKIKQRRRASSLVPVRLPLSHTRIAATMGIYAGMPGEVAPATADSELTIRMTSSMLLMSSVGELFAGTYIESIISGGVTANLVLQNSVKVGAKITVFDEYETVVFSGKVTRSDYNADTALWIVTAMDPLLEMGLDEEFQLEEKSDIADALPFEFDDLSERTGFPTIPVSSGITLRYWIDLIEAIRGARLFFDPEMERYVLSNKPRVWAAGEVLEFIETIDPSQYYNAIFAEQDDVFEQYAARETKTSDYNPFSLTIDRAGEQVYMTKLLRNGELLTSDTFKYNEYHQLIEKVSQKGTKTTTTKYIIQQGENPYISHEIAVTKDSLGETVFSERRVKTVGLLRGEEDDTKLVLVNESREWFEEEQVIMYE